MTKNIIAIIYSETSAAKFFDKKAYGELFASAQAQAVQSGQAFDLLSEESLKTADLSAYKALVFPSMANVKAADRDIITDRLAAASQSGAKLIVAGDFLTNDETGGAFAGNPYDRMASLLGVTRQAGGSITGVSELTASGGDSLVTYSDSTSYNTYTASGGAGTVVATQSNSAGASLTAVIDTPSALHFSDPRFFTDSGLVQAYLLASQPGALKMTRGSSLFVSRQDVDISGSAQFAPVVEAAVGDILQEWKTKYGFVGSNFINTTGVDWATMKPIYEKWLGLGNEIGSHSGTHPENVNLLTQAELAAEFKQSAEDLRLNLGVKANGFATPGNPENLVVDQALSSYAPDGYVSGVGGSSYTNSFGFITPEPNGALFLKPNVSFDFNLVEFKKRTTAQAEEQWLQEYEQILKTSGTTPVIEFSWHDYGVTTPEGSGFTLDGSVNPGYSKAIYENFIARAAKDGTEFVTATEFNDRYRAFQRADISARVNTTGGIEVEARGTDLGAFSYVAGSQGPIASVTGSFAYGANSVFLERAGGRFTIELGPKAKDISHVTSLGQRQELITASGDVNTGSLVVAFEGEGALTIDAKTLGFGQKYSLTGDVTLIKANWDLLEVKASGAGAHALDLKIVDIAPAISGTKKADRINGTSKGNVLSGGDGNDLIYGNGGDDALQGGAGNDRLLGGSGNDQLVGTSSETRGLNERDRLLGGSGQDLFILGDTQGSYYALDGLKGYAVVADFNATEDRVQLHGKASDYTVDGNNLLLGNDLVAQFTEPIDLSLSAFTFVI